MFNMICGMRSLGIYNYVVAAFDSEMFKICTEKGVPVFKAILPEDVLKVEKDGMCFRFSCCFVLMSELVFLKFVRLEIRRVWWSSF